jgi:hypothetical protein
MRRRTRCTDRLQFCLIIPTVAVAAPIPRKTYVREVSAIIREVDHNQAAYASHQHENAQASSMYVLRIELDLYIVKHELFRYRIALRFSPMWTARWPCLSVIRKTPPSCTRWPRVELRARSVWLLGSAGSASNPGLLER